MLYFRPASRTGIMQDVCLCSLGRDLLGKKPWETYSNGRQTRSVLIYFEVSRLEGSWEVVRCCLYGEKN